MPSAPSRPESDPTPVSINDYFSYSYLAQEELGFAVFGHRDPFRNIKRKYVFEITYGFYDVEDAQLRDRLRYVHTRLGELRSRRELFDTFFEGTPLENRARIEHELREVDTKLRETERAALELATVPQRASGTAELRTEILTLEGELSELLRASEAERTSLGNLLQLANQLEAQSDKLTRSIVSHKHLMDLEFVVCPRCGTGLERHRAESGTCVLCLQVPSLTYSRDTLIEEQGAVEYQLRETQDLLREREDRATDLETRLTRVRGEVAERKAELEFETRSYVSEQAKEIASVAAQRAQLIARSRQLHEYLDVLAKIDDTERIAAKFAVEKDKLDQQLAAAAAKSNKGYARVESLKEYFNLLLEELRPPKFGERDTSGINSTTYLPDYYGRAFVELSSPGLATLVNLAHALAHQLTAIKLGLKLPQLLVIDGLSEHLGQEGLDPERLRAAYGVLMRLAKTHPELQVILVDNEIPDEARGFVRLELSEEDRLIQERD